MTEYDKVRQAIMQIVGVEWAVNQILAIEGIAILTDDQSFPNFRHTSFWDESSRENYRRVYENCQRDMQEAGFRRVIQKEEK